MSSQYYVKGINVKSIFTVLVLITNLSFYGHNKPKDIAQLLALNEEEKLKR